MNENLKRRTFLRNMAFTGIAVSLPQTALEAMAFAPGSTMFQGTRFRLTVEPEGFFTVSRNNGSLLFRRCTSGAYTAFGKYTVGDARIQRLSKTPFRDDSGSGLQVLMVSVSNDKRLRFDTSIWLYDNAEQIVTETSCTNLGAEEMGITGLEPFNVTPEYNGSLLLPGVSRYITNGAMYYDAGRVQAFGQTYPELKPYGESKGGRFSDPQLHSGPETVNSWWNVGFSSGDDKEALVTGYLENRAGLGRLLFSQVQAGEIILRSESVFSPGTVLRSGQTIRSDRFVVLVGQNPYDALEAYAAFVGKLNNARVHSIINGWCNWFYTYEHITEDEILRNASFAAAHLKKYGMEYIQVDEGYQRWHGDWEGNARFPHGMAWLAEKIHGYGLKAGIWVAPYVISEPSGVFRDHPEWLLRNPDGSLRRVGPWPDEDTDWAKNESPKRFGLDVTHPGAAGWLSALTDTLVRRWGYDMIKVDFVAWSILSAYRYHDPAATPAGAYRLGYEIMRKAGGDHFHLLECGPGAVSVGLIDSMRIELDQNYGYGPEAWKQYFLDNSSSGPAAAKRYYFHGRTWINDADHLCINLLSVRQAQAAATLIAMSGGNTMSGDRLTELDANRMDILGKTLPSVGKAARPVNLFGQEGLALSLNVIKDFGRWTLAAFFNSGAEGILERTLSLMELTAENGTFLVYDFWQEKFLGEYTDAFPVKVEPESVTLLCIQRKTGVPQFLSANRHIIQGALELEQFRWDASTATLSGLSAGPAHSAHYVLVYMPEAVAFDQGHSGLFHDFGSFTVSRIDPQILKIGLRFEENDRISWSLRMADL